jgi:hypothetical protein
MSESAKPMSIHESFNDIRPDIPSPSIHEYVTRLEARLVQREAQIAHLEATAREFVAYWTTDRAYGGEVGCGMCGGIPHSTTCYVGRIAALLDPS